MSVEVSQLVEEFPELLNLVRGSPNYQIHSLSAPQNADPDSLIFVADKAHLNEAVKCPAKTWVVKKALLPEVPAQVPHVISSLNVQMSMALIGPRFFPQREHLRICGDVEIHPHAIISPDAKVGKGCLIGPGAVIGNGVEIGDNCVIGANAVLEPGVKIGPQSHIHPLVFIGRDCQIGARCIVKPNTTIGGDGYGYAQDPAFNHHRILHYGKVVVEDDVHIGAGVQIDRGTYLDSRIGAGTKIDNHCHFGHNIVIGRNTLITGGMITAGSVTIGSYCVFGGRTTVSGHLTIPDRTHVGGMSGIAQTIEKPGQYAGHPLVDLKTSLRTRVALTKLPQMMNQLRRILKHLGMEADDSSPNSHERQQES